MFNGPTLLGQTQTIINSGNLGYVKAGGSHPIMGVINIPNTVSDGLYDVNITMTDLAGNVNIVPATSNDIIRVKNYGPDISGEYPINNTTTTEPITVTIRDEYAGVDRNSIRMFILGQSYDNSSVINLEVTNNLVISTAANGYLLTYKPTWAWENTYKINVSVEASDKLGNKSSKSWYYTTSSQSPTIKNLTLQNRAPEGVEFPMTFTVEQCTNKIKKVHISIGKLGTISYVVDTTPEGLALKRTDDSLPGLPATITGVNAGACTGGTLYRYNFNNITFTVPDFAGNINNKIFITAVNDVDWESSYETYLITSKQKYRFLPKYLLLWKILLASNISGVKSVNWKVKIEPVGVNYKIYGQVNDVHRNLISYRAWRISRLPGNNKPIITEPWEGALYIDEDGEKIEWDHGKIPEVFDFDIDPPIRIIWPRGRPSNL